MKNDNAYDKNITPKNNPKKNDDYFENLIIPSLATSHASEYFLY